MRRSIVSFTFFVFPAMIGLAAIAKPLVLILLTEKWLPTVFFLQVCCFTYMLWPIHTANLQAINAIGRSDVYLKLEIVKKTIGIIAVVTTIPLGVHAMVVVRALTGVLSTIINAYPNKKLLDYSVFEQIKDIMPSFLLSFFMGMCIYLISFININSFLMMFLQIVFGVSIYVIGAKVFKFKCFEDILDIIKSFLKKGEKYGINSR